MTTPLSSCFAVNPQLANGSRLSHLHDRLLQICNLEQTARLGELLTGARLREFQKLLIGSSYASGQMCEHPEWLLALLQDGSLDAHFSETQFHADLPTQDLESEARDRALRLWRNRHMTRIIWRDFNRLCDTRSTVEELTMLAEAALQSSLDYHYGHLCRELGEPTNAEGERQPMLILGMGKLGAWELNLSSDIDLIFAYPENGETRGAARTLPNQDFFTRLGQRLIKSLDTVTPEGFVFRVDMRLRPYGQSGALVSNFDALEDYYQTQGREWERFAMIKARVVASTGSKDDSAALMSLLRSFTYRKYVDFSAIEALRNLKQLINREVARNKRSGDNVKIGRGGIREVEFIAQAFQIIRGGRDLELQERRVLEVLPLLRQLHCLPPGVDQRLAEAYCFLRNVEHAIQGYEDVQSQELPKDDMGRGRIAQVLGFDSWEAFFRRLNEHRDFVHQQFNAVIATPDEQTTDSQQRLADWRLCWHQVVRPGGDAATALERLGLAEPERAVRLLRDELLAAPAVVSMAALGRERFEALAPRLLQRLAVADNPVETLARLIPLLVATARRSAYLLLLTENPGALEQLVLLTQASPWIVQQLTRYPALLDELLDPATLYQVPPKSELEQELRLHVLRLAEDDLEQQMETLRYFRSSHALRVAACEVTGKLPLMRVSDYLTELAEVILDYVLQLCWRQMVTRHGYPDGEVHELPNFLIVAYGKLGGIELAHGSDLDLVFIHDANPVGSTQIQHEGQRSLDNASFYVRLGQKIIHILNTQTLSGQLYEVDMRLRPSGNSGMLVTSFGAFEKYQFESAWTWEHQALVRARAIAGRAALMARFSELRQRVLAQARDLVKLRKDVIEMREKMREHLGSKKKDRAEGQFHLKQDVGGIVDIEFMVQYAVLAWAHGNPALFEFTDNIRILGCLEAAGQLSAQEVNQLIEAYKAYRSLGHRLALQQQPGIVAGDQVESERRVVTQIWRRLLDSDTTLETHIT
jgi:glutamate-ammonia-ligase adenylyltransferase